MTQHEEASLLPPPGPEQRRIAAGQFERANEVIATGNYDYGIRLLLSCCDIDPANLIYRKSIRRAQKRKHNDNKRGSLLSWLTTAWPKAKIKTARRNRDWLEVLELGERALTKNPWDIGIQKDMAEAADRLGLVEMAVWILETAREVNETNIGLNRHLARLYEQQGDFQRAIRLWEKIRKADPTDNEAANKAKDLAAHETIARGQYERAAGGMSSGAGIAKKKEKTRERKEGKSKPKRSAPKETEENVNLDATEDVATGSSAIRMGGEEQGLLAKIESNPTTVHPYLQLSALYRRTSRSDAAREMLQKALGPTANDFDIVMELADLEVEPFRQNLALTEKRLAESGEDEELHKIRIRLRKEINSRELEILRQKADRFPTDLNHRFEIGLRLLRAGQLEEAITELQKARADSRLHWKAALYLGHCFKGRNNWRLAKRNFEDALQHIPESETEARKELLFQLAQGCADAGELKEAIDWGHELANIDFGYKGVGNLLDAWEAQQNESGA